MTKKVDGPGPMGANRTDSADSMHGSTSSNELPDAILVETCAYEQVEPAVMAFSSPTQPHQRFDDKQSGRPTGFPLHYPADRKHEHVCSNS